MQNVNNAQKHLKIIALYAENVINEYVYVYKIFVL